MPSARDVVTRWPALQTPARHARLHETIRLAPGPLLSTLTLRAADAERAAAGLWRRDPSVWSADTAVRQAILNRLGWLDSPFVMADALDRLRTFASAVTRDGFADVVLLGMGGSSLAPDVLRAVLGVHPASPRFHMLDSTDPAAVQAASTPPEHTLYLLASKSGTTIEPSSLAAHFRWVLEDAGIQRWADHFVAITDEGTDLARRARAEGFRDLFINPGDIGGRYSALSFFGLVPAALMGQDLDALVGWGVAMLSASEPGSGSPGSPGSLTGVLTNPSVALGLAIGGAAADGRDKLTLMLPPALEPFGLWVEQLIAESTGKHGTGVIPIAGETVAPAAEYGDDRFFVSARFDSERSPGLHDLEAANVPIAEITLAEPSALGAEFVRWEIATAIAGALLHINPFDEPNVAQAKSATRTLLDGYASQGRLDVPAPDRTTSTGATLTVTAAARRKLRGAGPESVLTLLRPGDYLAVLAYLAPDPELADDVRRFRHAVRAATHAATMFGYGPRYLHSTGQLHKGGPNTGVFVLISAAPRADVAIPGEGYSFGTLELAQALGDFASLDATTRRAVHVHLPAPDRRLLAEFMDSWLERVTRST